jgi:hypothetical protein
MKNIVDFEGASWTPCDNLPCNDGANDDGLGILVISFLFLNISENKFASNYKTICLSCI